MPRTQQPDDGWDGWEDIAAERADRLSLTIAQIEDRYERNELDARGPQS